MTLCTKMSYIAYDHARLKSERRGRGWTQRDVADALGVHRNTIHRMEKGSAASYGLISNVCALYEIPLRSVTTGRSRRIPDRRGKRINVETN